MTKKHAELLKLKLVFLFILVFFIGCKFPLDVEDLPLGETADINDLDVVTLDGIVFDSLTLINDPNVSKYPFYYYIPSSVQGQQDVTGRAHINDTGSGALEGAG